MTARGYEDVFQDADFASWVGIVKAPHHHRAAAKEQHGRDPLLFELPVLADPAKSGQIADCELQARFVQLFRSLTIQLRKSG
jgi:hypothetical protein